MKRIILLLGAVLLSGIVGTIYFLTSDPAKAWIIQGDTFRNKRYPIYLENEPKWIPVFPPRTLFKRPGYLLVLAKKMPGNADQDEWSEIAVPLVESTIRDNIRIIKPLTYLQMIINVLRRSYFKFEELQSPSVAFLNGEEVATGQFLSMAHPDSKPVMSMSYDFVSGNQGCGIVYSASSNQFEKNREDAMRIIRSFEFGRRGNGQEAVNSWSVRGRSFCSKKYDVCVANEPKWSIKVPARDVFRREEPIISFLALNFYPARISPDVEAEVFIFPSEKLQSKNYEISSPLDYLLLLRRQSQGMGNDFHVVEQPALGTMNGREVASVRYAFRDAEKNILEMKVVAFIADRKAYAIFYRAKEEQFEKYLSEAMRIIESFRPARNGK